MAEFLNEIELWTESGKLLIVDLRNALIRSAAPDASTKGRQGMQCYVVSGNTISEEFVCTAVSGNRYTWVRRERQNTTVDTTLTVSGAAADAATVGEKLTEQNTKKADLDTVPNRAVMQGNTMKFQRSTVSNGATTTKNLFEVQIPTGGSSEGGTADGGGDGSLFPYIWKKYKGDPNTVTYTDGSDVLYIAKRGYPTDNRTTVYYSDEINTGMGGISLADPVQIDIPVTQDGATTAAVLKGKYVTLGSNKNIYFIPEDARIIMAGSAPMYDIRATTYQTVEGAEFLGFVTAETSDAYPKNGVDSTDGCWYVGGGLIADLTDINAAVDVDDTLMVSGAAADAAVVGKKVSELSEAITDLGTVYIGKEPPTDGTLYWLDTSDSETEPETVTYTVTKNLTNATIDNAAETVAEKSSYAATLTADEGYTLSSVTVTMGGADITSASYDAGNVYIASVTGDIVITAVAVETAETVLYTVTNNLVNVSTSNTAISAEDGTSYMATLTVADGYSIDTVTVTMGGIDITADVYADGVINITAVTGDVVITVTAKESPGEPVEMTWDNSCFGDVYSDAGETLLTTLSGSTGRGGYYSAPFEVETTLNISLVVAEYQTCYLGYGDGHTYRASHIYNAAKYNGGIHEFTYTVPAGKCLMITGCYQSHVTPTVYKKG